MFNLIRNESEKVFRKYSTYVLIGLMALFLFGVQWLIKASSGGGDYRWYPDEASLSEEIMFYESQGMEEEARVWKFYRDNLLDSQVPADSWRLEALRISYAGGDESEIRETEAMARTGNWQGYYQRMVRQIQENSEYTEQDKEMMSYPYRYLLEHQVDPDDRPWQWDVAMQYQSNVGTVMALQKLEASGNLTDPAELEKARADAEIARYRLENDVEYVAVKGEYGYRYPRGVWDAVDSTSSIILILSSVFLLIIAGGCVSREFSSGTIKFLLINPVKRQKIFWSKYLMMLALSAVTLIAGFLLNLGAAVLIQGGQGLQATYLFFDGSAVREGSVLLICAGQYFAGAVSAIVMMSLSFMISSVLRSSAVAIGISITCLLVGSMVVEFMAELQIDWGRYLIFANTGLAEIMQGNSKFAHQSLGFALIVLALHMAAFLWIARDGFVKKEV